MLLIDLVVFGRKMTLSHWSNWC